MRHIDFEPSALTGKNRRWWDRWAARAAEATRKTLNEFDNHGELVFEDNIWTQLKPWLLANVFHSKCAYCEESTGGGFFGDGEHYRPKAKVTEEARPDGKPHSGYYWLAYEWRNLLPSCQKCNNRKGNWFPIEGDRAFGPGDGSDPAILDQKEKPLLLHPYRDDPTEHLKFWPLGRVTPRTHKGHTTIQVLRLDRKELEEQRAKRQKDARRGFALMLTDRARDTSASIEEAMAEFTGAEAEFSGAVYDYLYFVKDEVIKEIETAFTRKRGSFEDIAEATMSILQEVARRDVNDPASVVTYHELRCELERRGLKVSYDEAGMLYILDELSLRADAARRGMISALVVQADTRRPPREFFKLARQKPFDRAGDDDSLWLMECATVRKAHEHCHC
jgi:uncharacterized protein (TIGR02646 family)